MDQLEILTREDHGSLRLLPPGYADRHFVQIVVGEILAAAAQHPVLFNKHPDSGRFYIGAVSGFKAGENLFVNDGDRYEGYRPFDMLREAFFVGDDAILIDPASPRYSRTAGEMLFDDAGEPAPALNTVRHALTQLKLGLEDTDAFIRTLLDLDLVEPIDIALSFDDGEKIALDGVYTVSLDALRRLDDTRSIDLFRRGYLQYAYAIVASLRQIPILARRRNDRLRNG